MQLWTAVVMADLKLGRLVPILEGFLHHLQLLPQICASLHELRHMLTVGRCISLSLHDIDKPMAGQLGGRLVHLQCVETHKLLLAECMHAQACRTSGQAMGKAGPLLQGGAAASAA